MDTVIVTLLCSIISSSGFWAFLISRKKKADAINNMVLGLGHDRIIELGMHYLERTDENGNPWITEDEYENIKDYLYEPYTKLGGNGSAARIIKEMDNIPICKTKKKGE